MTTPGFKTPLLVQWIPEDQEWELTEPLVWQGVEGDQIVVPAGFRTDFASTPRVFQNIFPATGPWTLAAVIHDLLCRLLNEYRAAHKVWEREHKAWERNCAGLGRRPYPPAPVEPEPPVFSSVDADNVFRLIMRDEGTPVWLAQFGWVGVRYGALGNPARRCGSLSTLAEVLWFTGFYLFIAAVLITILFVFPIALVIL